MRVHPNLGDHHGEFGIGVAIDHGLTDFRLKVARPNVRDAVLLGVNGTGKLGDRHVQKHFVNGCFLSECLLVLVVTVLENFLERNAGLGHVGHRDAPVVVGGAEGDRTVLDGHLPGLAHAFGSELLDQLVDLLDGLRKASHHVFGRDLQFVDEAVDLVDEKNRLHLLFQTLDEPRFRFEAWGPQPHRQE